MQWFFLSLIAALGSLGAPGCSDTTKLIARCQGDAQCVEEHGGNPNWACDALVGDCVCTADAACGGDREHCEVRPGGDGKCHPNRSCEWNPDCTSGLFCDTVNRICRLTGCERDLQCSSGEVCDSILKTCVSGCRSHGDCILGEACLCTDAAGSKSACDCTQSEDERSSCAVGVCVAGTCTDKSFCRLGDLCIPPEIEGELSHCQTDERGPYCQNCIQQPGATLCGSEGPNFCLIDSNDAAGAATFCGVDCSLGNECPNGFSCHEVLVLTQSVCRSDEQCMPTGGECRNEADCPAGARCAKGAGQEVGHCGGRCSVGEGKQSGFCTCVEDEDCPPQSCGADGRCSITRQRCVPGQDDTCRGADRIVCVNDGKLGYCKVGRNCAPDDGIKCSEVRCEQNPSGCEPADY